MPAFVGNSVAGIRPGLSSGRFDPAVAAWTRLLGSARVDTSRTTRNRFARTTGIEGRQPIVVLQPQSTAEVQGILAVAREFGMPVHPVSKGKNWGYGDACPPGEGQAIIDLGRMNRILEINKELCYAVIEPGVTQGELYRSLELNKTGLWMDATGAGPDASVVGNVLERGFGHTRYGDRFLSTCGMEIVLADGQILHTGLGHYAHAHAVHAYRYGVGPLLDGLFTQSNFGIVTRMGVGLMPRPQAFAGFFVSAANDSDLSTIVDRLARLRLQGLLQSTVHIANDLRALSGRMSYPFERAAGKTPLPADLRAALRREHAIGAWNACGSLYGTRQTVAGLKKQLARSLRGFKLVFLDDQTIGFADKLVRLLGKFRAGHSLANRLEMVKPIYGLLKGIPTAEALRGAAWRVRGAQPGGAPCDPLDCHAGLLWISPTLPAQGNHANRVVRLMEPIFQKHGFDPLFTLSQVTDRALCCVSNIAFDRRCPDEMANAHDCYDELTTAVMKAGYIPYRTSPQSTARLAEGSSGFWEVAAQIKNALDPLHLISPGRYEPLLGMQKPERHFPIARAS